MWEGNMVFVYIYATCFKNISTSPFFRRKKLEKLMSRYMAMLLILGTRKRLWEREKGEIEAFFGMDISKTFNRLHCVVRWLLIDLKSYGTAGSPDHSKITSERDKRRLIKAASNSTMGCAKIKNRLNFDLSSYAIRRVDLHLVCAEMGKIPRLTVKPKADRFEFARSLLILLKLII